jgi:hypothetical protein
MTQALPFLEWMFQRDSLKDSPRNKSYNINSMNTERDFKQKLIGLFNTFVKSLFFNSTRILTRGIRD